MFQNIENTASDEILIVTKLYRDRNEGEILLKCPHCARIIGLNGDEEDEIDFEGAQFEDNICKGTFEIGDNPVFIKDVDAL